MKKNDAKILEKIFNGKNKASEYPDAKVLEMEHLRYIQKSNGLLLLRTKGMAMLRGYLALDREEKVKKLWKNKEGDYRFFLAHKASEGFRSYTFEELVRLQGYEKAAMLVHEYLKLPGTKFNPSILTTTYMKIHCDGFYFKAGTKVSQYEFYVDYSGKMMCADRHFRDWMVETEHKEGNVDFRAKPVFFSEEENLEIFIEQKTVAAYEHQI